MTAKEYLEQAKNLDVRIDSKIEQLNSLNALAAKCTSALTGIPKNPNGSTSRLEDVVVKMIDLQEEINSDIDALVDLKSEIMGIIKAVENPVYQAVLEKRYLCFLPWEQIAREFGCTVRHLYRLHEAALREVTIP